MEWIKDLHVHVFLHDNDDHNSGNNKSKFQRIKDHEICYSS